MGIAWQGRGIDSVSSSSILILVFSHVYDRHTEGIRICTTLENFRPQNEY
jgi:hypothetical protein